MDMRGSPSAAVGIYQTNKQAAATMCSAAEAIKLLLGGSLGVELATALLEAKTEEQLKKERAESLLSWITGGLLGGGSPEGGDRAGCTSESARAAIMTTAYFALLCITAVPTAGAFAAEALHALSCCPAGAELLLRQPTPLLTCGIQGLIPMLHPVRATHRPSVHNACRGGGGVENKNKRAFVMFVVPSASVVGWVVLFTANGDALKATLVPFQTSLEPTARVYAVTSGCQLSSRCFRSKRLRVSVCLLLVSLPVGQHGVGFRRGGDRGHRGGHQRDPRFSRAAPG